jgi:hypothetical protein
MFPPDAEFFALIVRPRSGSIETVGAVTSTRRFNAHHECAGETSEN